MMQSAGSGMDAGSAAVPLDAALVFNEEAFAER